MEILYLEILRNALSESGLSLSVEELQIKLQEVRVFDEVLEDDVFQGAQGQKFLDRWLNRIKDLWNYTPRSDLAGKRPTEKLTELMQRGAPVNEVGAVPVIVPSDFP